MSLCLSSKVILLWWITHPPSSSNSKQPLVTISWRNAPLFTPHLLVLETIVCTQDFNALALLVYRFLNVEHFFSRLVEAVVISFVLQRCFRASGFSKANQKPIMMMTLKEGSTDCLADFAQCSFLQSKKYKVLSDLQVNPMNE